MENNLERQWQSISKTIRLTHLLRPIILSFQIIEKLLFDDLQPIFNEVASQCLTVRRAQD